MPIRYACRPTWPQTKENRQGSAVSPRDAAIGLATPLSAALQFLAKTNRRCAQRLTRPHRILQPRATRQAKIRADTDAVDAACAAAARSAIMFAPSA